MEASAVAGAMSTGPNMSQATSLVCDAELMEFAYRWGLASEAKAVLMDLDPFVQKAVMTKFAPTTDAGVPANNLSEAGKPIDSAFVAFARNMAKLHSPGSSMQEDLLSDFIQRWGLGADAQAVLMNLLPEIQRVVISSFTPRTEVGQVANSFHDLGRPVDGKFIVFARSVESNHKGLWKGKDKAKGKTGGKFLATPMMMGPNSSMGNDGCWMFAPGYGKGAKCNCKGCGCGEFHAQWDSSSWMHGAPPRENELAVTDFIQRWRLADDAQTVLLSLTPECQHIVTTNFAPKTDQGNVAQCVADLGRPVDGKLILFARGVEKTHSGGKVGYGKFGKLKGKGPSWFGPSHGKGKCGPMQWSGCSGMICEAPPAQLALSAADAERHEVSLFCMRWGLGYEAQRVLFDMNPTVASKVMQSWAPINEQGFKCSCVAELGQDCENMFIAFARNLEHCLGFDHASTGYDAGRGCVDDSVSYACGGWGGCCGCNDGCAAGCGASCSDGCGGGFGACCGGSFSAGWGSCNTVGISASMQPSLTGQFPGGPGHQMGGSMGVGPRVDGENRAPIVGSPADVASADACGVSSLREGSAIGDSTNTGSGVAATATTASGENVGDTSLARGAVGSRDDGKGHELDTVPAKKSRTLE
eukprot:TRINITY_DN5973_c0_g1_i6.p1 TRINITY_DN5973_c0_g1~~TRINITY_DN5973_c0_g1_i6.p1  ORF type:complete len:684 (+),score=108.95 TRINITY_DN5973_c0_g1_i6:130-2052(+)